MKKNLDQTPNKFFAAIPLEVEEKPSHFTLSFPQSLVDLLGIEAGDLIKFEAKKL